MINITFLADTHGVHRYTSLRGGDILIIGGDIFDINQTLPPENIAEWLLKVPYTYKFIIPGNHDKKLEIFPKIKNTFILNHNDITISDFSIYGAPAIILQEDTEEFSYKTCTEEELKKRLPNKKYDILVTHGPPKGILDIKQGKNVGSNSLYEYIQNYPPKYHLFGHAHHSKGIFKNKKTTFINGSIVENPSFPYINNFPVNIIYDPNIT
jgi:Icc-related predicted phosphoesterase